MRQHETENNQLNQQLNKAQRPTMGSHEFWGISSYRDERMHLKISNKVSHEEDETKRGDQS